MGMGQKGRENGLGKGEAGGGRTRGICWMLRRLLKLQLFYFCFSVGLFLRRPASTDDLFRGHVVVTLYVVVAASAVTSSAVGVASASAWPLA